MKEQQEVLEKNFVMTMEQIKMIMEQIKDKNNEIEKLRMKANEYQCLLRESGAQRLRENINSGITHAINPKSFFNTLCGIGGCSIGYMRYGVGPTCENCIRILKVKENREQREQKVPK